MNYQQGTNYSGFSNYTNQTSHNQQSRPDPVWVEQLSLWVYPSETLTDPATGRVTKTQPLMLNAATRQWEPLPEQYWQIAFGTASSAAEPQAYVADRGQEVEPQPEEKFYPTTTDPFEQRMEHVAAEDSALSAMAQEPKEAQSPTPQPAAEPVASQPAASQPVATQQHAFNDDELLGIAPAVKPTPVSTDPQSLEKLAQMGTHYPPRSQMRDEPDDIMVDDSFDDDATILSAEPVKAMLRVDDGTSEVVHGDVLIGRRPRLQAEYPTAQPLKIVDKKKSMSKVHALLRPVSTGLEVTDLSSTNGTWIIFPDGHREDVTVGRTIIAPPGAQIHMGNRFVTVEM